ncbi:MAG: molybdopterin dehydrogenase [Actinobacteria bacterium]|nr:molybdopterin dehydrogenase [Actinomycetota bacterium]
MRRFKHFDASSLDEAVSLLARFEGRAKVIAGGTDIVGTLKDSVLPEPYEALVNIKTIPGLEGIRNGAGVLKIGALTRLEDIAHNETVQTKYAALAQAARVVATPHIREMGTIAGNICQNTRCWYYRCAHNRFHCVRKGHAAPGQSLECFASDGDNRYHSIFGDVKDCLAVNPSDTIPALIALGATLKTTKRSIAVKDIFPPSDEPTKMTIIDSDEIVIEVEIPEPQASSRSAYHKVAIRKSIDFPIVNCAAVVDFEGDVVKDCHICLNAVHYKPYVPERAEALLEGEPLTDEQAATAGEAAVWGAKPLPMNSYKITMAKGLVKKILIACREAG